MNKKNPKIIAFYLPQYHAIPENNKWWGEGFTEWTNTKKARPLFKEHQQPKIPLNENYYCLLESEVQEWQANLAKKNGIYGFCYYHYWFNGKMLLEKPMENMVKNKNIKLPFCISWANEPWARTWDGKNRNILMPQKYGDENDWKIHFEYLLQFFKDERYIKINNKPVLIIYRTKSIPRCEALIDYWNNLCIEHNFDGIYLIETMNSFQKESFAKNSNAVVEFEPMLTIKHYLPLHIQAIRFLKKKLNILDKLNYDNVWNAVLDKNKNYDKEKFLSSFISWDNTARKQNKGLVLTEDSSEKFSKYFSKQYEKATNNKSEFIFINAWNEWAEGTYLEPDTKNKYKYLDEIKRINNNGEQK